MNKKPERKFLAINNPYLPYLDNIEIIQNLSSNIKPVFTAYDFDDESKNKFYKMIINSQKRISKKASFIQRILPKIKKETDGLLKFYNKQKNDEFIKNENLREDLKIKSYGEKKIVEKISKIQIDEIQKHIRNLKDEKKKGKKIIKYTGF